MIEYSKKKRENFLKNALKRKNKKLGSKFNLELPQIGLWTTGPWGLFLESPGNFSGFVFVFNIKVSIISKMNLTVNELKLTGLWARNHYLTGLDFKICLRTRKVSGPVFKPSLLVDMPT